MILTYKYRLKDRAARHLLRRHARAANQVWNWCVAGQKDIQARYDAGAPKRPWPSYIDLSALCNGVGKDLGINQQTVEGVCQQFIVSRDKTGHAPRFRASYGGKRALGWVPFKKRSRQLSGNAVRYLGKTFRFFGSKRRPLPADDVRGGTFVEDARGRWYVCFNVEVAESQSAVGGSVGIDLGLKALATCSDGYVIDAPRIYRCHEVRLAIAQRSGNRRRAKAIHAKIKNCRRDFIHKATAKIVRENALIAVGNVKSSRFAKTRMAKSVSDAGWSMFRSQLRYKASRHGSVYLDVDEKFTTQVCSRCGCNPASSPKGMGALGIREWKCSECGASHDRDVNAARNILALALSAQRLDGGSRLAAAG